jgi:2-C-methyl-D-erythritol 4-phosphate cytidylyltransferase
MKRWSIIVAGGTGSRMGSDVPKQFLVLKGKPVLMHSIEKFSKHCDEVIVALAEDRMEEWKKLCNSYDFKIRHQVIAGGLMRAESVRNGLEMIDGNGVVAVHDAARPLVSENLIERLFKMAEQQSTAVPVIRVGDSLRKLNGATSRAVDRNDYRLVQTPQCFDCSLLRKAFLQPGFRNFTDEASLAEAASYEVHLVEGEATNIKITVPGDLSYAETLVL